MVLTVPEDRPIPPPGRYTGEILSASESTRDFGEGPEPVVEVVMGVQMPGGKHALVDVIFTPSLHRQSALRQMLGRLGRDFAEGDSFDVASMVGTECQFKLEHNQKGFPKIVKETIVKA